MLHGKTPCGKGTLVIPRGVHQLNPIARVYEGHFEKGVPTTGETNFENDSGSGCACAAGLAIQNMTCSCSVAEVARIASAPRLTISLGSLATTVDDAMVKLSCAASLCAISLNPDLNPCTYHWHPSG